MATAPIRPLAREPPQATSAALKRKQNVLSPYKKGNVGVPVVAQWVTNPTRNHEVAGSVPGLAQWVEDPALL